jgi:PAS domain S-box-containing protein
VCSGAEATVPAGSDDQSAVETALLHKLVDSIPGMVAYWDSTLHCRFANRAYERWFGITPEFLKGKHVSDLLGPLYALNLPHIEAALRGEPQEFEREVPDPAGGPSRRGLINYVPDVVDDAVQGFFVMVTDISAIKRAEQALRDSEERFRLTIDEAPIGMALVGPDGRALRVNRALSEILGYSLEELTGMGFREVTYPPDLSADLDLLGQLISGKIHRYQLEKRYVRKDGRLVDTLLSASAVRAPDGHPLYFIAQVEDITERKRLADELRAAEEKSSGILAISADAIISIDDQQRITMFNRSAERAFGRTAAEVLGEPLDILIPARFQAVHRRHVEEFSAGSEVARHTSEHGTEVFGVRKNGEEFPADATISKLEIDGQKLLTVALRDISEQKQAQDLIRQTQERLELALKGADLASWDWNIETGEVVFNRRWVEMLGYDPDELRPHVDTWIGTVHPEDWPRVKRALDDCCRGATPFYESEHRLCTKSGAFIWVLDRGKIFARSDQGEALRMVGTELDITERKRIQDGQAFLAEVGTILASSLQMEETLSRIARVSLGSLADCVIVDIVEDDGDGLSRVLVVHADPTKEPLCEQIKRFRLARGRSLSGAEKPSAEKPRLVPEIDDSQLVAVAESEEHLRVIRELGPKSLISVPLRGREGALGTLTFISTSKRRYTARDLELATDLAYRAGLAIDNARLYETARRATRVRDEVLGIVAHDLRNPLGTVLMQTALLGRRGTEPDRAVEAVERAAHRMNRLIQDLLDITQIEAEKLSLERSALNARRIVTDSVDTQAMLASSASLTLEPDVADDLPTLWADKDRLSQVFENLIGNAVKFTPEGGKICVGAAPHDADVLFWVKDTGAGIAPEDVPHLFDRFWQARKGKRHGAGLGLPIVKGIVEAHGGHVWVESTLGGGSTFFFTIPAARPFEPRGLV